MPIALTGLFIYPVKSLRGVSLDVARVEGGRMAGDREWMLVGPDGRFLHQRDLPRMARIRVLQTPDGVMVGAAGQHDLLLQPPPREVPVEHLRGWRRLTPVRHGGPAADEWFSAALGVPARLMAFAPDTPAREVPSWEINSALQDATPFHLISRDSLDDLDRRIGHPIPMNRFRANLVVTGAPVYAEDRWREVQVGDLRLRWIKPCTRCVMTTTDQETGERPSTEPLRTLATYRRVGSSVHFGHYLTGAGSSTLRLGDTLTVLTEEAT